MLIIGDIGGTKTNLALFKEGDFSYQNLKTFPSSSYPDLITILLQYLKEIDSTIKFSSACFAVAGPIENGICRTTNLPWVIDIKEVKQAIKIPQTFLINDLEANAYAIEILDEKSLFTLHSGIPLANGNRAVISPGTGLGEAGILWDHTSYRPFATEGGHADFAPMSDLQRELWDYLRKMHDHVSYERVISGLAFYNLYRFFIDVKKMQEPVWLAQALTEQDHGKVITENARSGKSEACEQTLDLFVEILGQEAGNVALKYLAVGGLYLGGGIPPRILDFLKGSKFLQGFLNKGRFRTLLESIPIHVILNDKASLIGAALYGHKNVAQIYSLKFSL